MKKLALFFSLAVLINGCSRNSDCDLEVNLSANDQQLQSDIEAIDLYLSDNEIQAQIDPSGLRYVILSNGDDGTAELCDNITFSYTGSLVSDGTVFDESDSPISFDLSQLIHGFQIGIPLIEKGGSIRLYIPSVYGYGSQGAGDNIPPNANLIFDVELIDID